MKTATFPAVRTAPALRSMAESLLGEGETLSQFIEDSLQRNIHRRLSDQDFIARGLASRDDAKATGKYVTVEHTLGRLRAIHDATFKRAPE